MPRWTWRDGIYEAGRCVLVDVDGVIADGGHRQHLLAGPKKRWQDFFRAAIDDPPLLAGITLADLVDADTLVVLVTSRPESIHDDTVAWLEAHEVRWDLLVMRSRRDHGPAAAVKRLALEELRYAGFEPVLAIDDDPDNVAMYTEEQVPALYLHSDHHPG